MARLFFIVTLYLVLSGCATRPVLTKVEAEQQVYERQAKREEEADKIRSLLRACKAGGHAIIFDTRSVSFSEMRRLKLRSNKDFAYIPKRLRLSDVRCVTQNSVRRILNRAY